MKSLGFPLISRHDRIARTPNDDEEDEEEQQEEQEEQEDDSVR